MKFYRSSRPFQQGYCLMIRLVIDLWLAVEHHPCERADGGYRQLPTRVAGVFQTAAQAGKPSHRTGESRTSPPLITLRYRPALGEFSGVCAVNPGPFHSATTNSFATTSRPVLRLT